MPPTPNTDQQATPGAMPTPRICHSPTLTLPEQRSRDPLGTARAGRVGGSGHGLGHLHPTQACPAQPAPPGCSAAKGEAARWGVGPAAGRLRWKDPVMLLGAAGGELDRRAVLVARRKGGRGPVSPAGLSSRPCGELREDSGG